MAKLVCGASDLKCDKQNLRNEVWTGCTCEPCDLFEVEDSKHLIFRYPSLLQIRNEMFDSINNACGGIGYQVLNSATNLHAMFMEKINSNYPDEASHVTSSD